MIVAEPIDEIVPAGPLLMLLPVLVPVGPLTWSREIRGRALFLGPSFSRSITDIGLARCRANDYGEVVPTSVLNASQGFDGMGRSCRVRRRFLSVTSDR